MLLALGDGQAISVGTQAAGEQGVAVDDEVLWRDGGRDIGVRSLDELDGIARRSVPRGRDDALEVRRLAAGPAVADHRREMLLEFVVAFAGAPLEAFTVADVDDAAARRDQRVLLEAL